MATDAEAQALGFATPTGTDPIRDGDNAVAQNARATVDLFRQDGFLLERMTATAIALPAGSAPTASIAGTLANKVINFGIPRGADGLPGADGMGYAEGQQLLADSQQAAADAAEAVTLAQQAQAAALEVPDANVSALLGNPATDTSAAVDALISTRVPVTQVSVDAMPSWTGNPADDQTAAFIEAANAHPGACTVLIPEGTWRVQGAPIREGLYYVGTGIATTKLILPSVVAADTPMFKATATGPISSGGFSGLRMTGDATRGGLTPTAGVHGIDLFTFSQTLGFFITECLVEKFDIGVRGAQSGSNTAIGDDRWLVVKDSLLWDNKIGMFAHEHPQINGADFRQNQTGLTGRLYDLNLVGKNKFVRNKVAVCPDTLNGQGGMESSFVNGAIFFRNSTAIILGHDTLVTGCFIEGGEWDPATNANSSGNSVGVVVSHGSTRVNIVGNNFSPSVGVEHGTAIRLDNPLAHDGALQITGNMFGQFTAGKRSIYSATGTQGVKISDNTFRLEGGSDGVVCDAEAYEWVVTNNRAGVYAGATFVKFASIKKGDVSDNTIKVQGGAGIWTRPVVNVGTNTSGYPYRVSGNQFHGGWGSDATALSLDGRLALVTDNIVPSPLQLVFAYAPSKNAGTLVTNNVGFRTVARGDAIILDGNNSVIVNHGLARTPTTVMVSPLGEKIVWATNRTATTFTIVRPSADVAGHFTVAWVAYALEE